MAFLVENESAKLFANAWDRVSSGCFLIGVFGPVASVMYGAQPQIDYPSFLTVALLWVFAGIITHFQARETIATLQE